MRRTVQAAFILLLTGCGGGAHRGAASDRTPLTIEVPKQSSEPESGGESAPAAGSDRNADSLIACAAKLRDARDVAAAEGERRIYDDALAAERHNDLSTARKGYFQLIQQFPASKLIPLAYLAFGELFTVETESDASKAELARQSYMEVVKYPPPDNIAYAYALLRLGNSRRGDSPQDALSHYTRAIEAARQYGSLSCSELIRNEARARLASVYAEAGQPERAFVFFNRYGDSNEALEMMERLLESYRRFDNRTSACLAIRGIPEQLSEPRAARLRAQSGQLCAKP